METFATVIKFMTSMNRTAPDEDLAWLGTRCHQCRQCLWFDMYSVLSTQRAIQIVMYVCNDAMDEWHKLSGRAFVLKEDILNIYVIQKHTYANV